jgi:hypothetical protein
MLFKALETRLIKAYPDEYVNSNIWLVREQAALIDISLPVKSTNYVNVHSLHETPILYPQLTEVSLPDSL